MINKFISNEFDSIELQEMIFEYFLSSEINDGYRYFPKDSIEIDYQNRKITFKLLENEKGYGASDFNNRVKADKTFLDSRYLAFLNGFNFEQKMFDNSIKTDDIELSKNYKTPQIGGRAVITQTSMYLDESKELFIAIPLAIPNETYGLQGKLTGSNMVMGNSRVRIDKILKITDPRRGNKEGNELFELQRKNPKEKIITNVNEFKFGEWSCSFELPNKKYSEIKNVHIGRANDGAFEILSSKLFRSYEDVVSNYHINENIGFNRPVCLVSVLDLLKSNDGESLLVKKLFYENLNIDFEELNNVLPKDFANVFELNDGKLVIKTFNKTPPLKQFIGKAKTLLLTDEFSGVIKELINETEISKGIQKNTIGKKSENIFGDKFGLEKSSKLLKGNINFSGDYIKIINDSSFNSERKKILIEYLNNKKTNITNYEFYVDPDFILSTSNSSYILIEHKNSKKAQKKEQRIHAELLILFGTERIDSYNIIIGNNYGINDEHKGEGVRVISENYLEKTGINTRERLIDFLGRKI